MPLAFECGCGAVRVSARDSCCLGGRKVAIRADCFCDSCADAVAYCEFGRCCGSICSDGMTAFVPCDRCKQITRKEQLGTVGSWDKIRG